MTAKKAVEIIIKQKIGPPPSPKESHNSSVNTTPLSRVHSIPDLSVDSNPASLPRPPSFSSQASTPNSNTKNVSTPVHAAIKPPSKDITPVGNKKTPIASDHKAILSPGKDEPTVTKAGCGGLVWRIDVPGKQEGETAKPPSAQAKQIRPRPAPLTTSNPSDRKDNMHPSEEKRISDGAPHANSKVSSVVAPGKVAPITKEHKPVHGDVSELSPTKRAGTPNSVRFVLPVEPQAKDVLVAEAVVAALVDTSLLDNNISNNNINSKPRSASAGKRPISTGKGPIVSNKLSNYGQVKIMIDNFTLFLFCPGLRYWIFA